jgi:hypothetical protein
MVKINPFSTGYKKQEDKITALLNHVLEECKLSNIFLSHFLDDNFKECNFELDLQLHNKFKKPVNKAILIGICNQVEGEDKETDKEDGNPDAYFYDKKNKILVLIETKIGIGKLANDQMERHKKKLDKNFNWIEKIIYWDEVVSFFDKIYESIDNELEKYIIRHFSGTLYQDVLGVFDFDYYCHLAGNYSTLVRNILLHLEEKFDGYRKELVNKTHDELRFYTEGQQKDRFFTIVLRHNRVILHYTGDQGFLLRREFKERYGIHYLQTNRHGSEEIYIKELSIPFDRINKYTLKLKEIIVHETSFHNDIVDLLDLKELIKHCLKENSKLKSKIIYNN